MLGQLGNGFRFILAATLGLALPCQAWGQQDSLDRDYEAELPRYPAVNPQEAMSQFEVAAGFQLEQVAAEPLVADPVAFAFDAQYRLFVVEMHDYSEQADEHLGVIALLEDSDADGEFDSRTTFAEGLSWPTAIWPWRDGVLVAHAPYLTWFRDTDGDGRSDTRETWFEGFGRSNVQGLVNSLRWTVEGDIHGATSSVGASLTSGVAGSAGLTLNRRDFAIDPVSKLIRAASGGGQHGLSFNDWGDKFVTSNSDHLQQVLDLESWLGTHASQAAIPQLRRSIAADGPQAEVFRSSPVEPWRIVRTRLRTQGLVPGPVEGGGRAAGYFTGATGTCVVGEASAFGLSGYDTALVCDVGSNLVHRKKLVDHGLFWEATRIDPAGELVRSSDTWFRPVQLGDGPDGGVYIADMYREVIEHPKSLPPIIKQHLDLTSGRERGRIYRLRCDAAAWQAERMGGLPKPPAQLSDLELVTRLVHPLAWQRRMASQLLVERFTNLAGAVLPLPADVKSQLIEATLGASPEGRIVAMHVLGRLGEFSAAIAKPQFQAGAHERVVQHALNLVRGHGLGDELTTELRAMDVRERPRLQLALVMLAADLESAERMAVLKRVLPVAGEPIVQWAISAAGGSQLWSVLAGLDEEAMPVEFRRQWIVRLLPDWLVDCQDDAALRRWLVGQVFEAGPSQLMWLDALAGLPQPQLAQAFLGLASQDQVDQIQTRIVAGLAGAGLTPNAVRRLRLVDAETQLAAVSRLLQPRTSETVQRELIGLLEWSVDSRLIDLVLDRLAGLTPQLQHEALQKIASRSAAVGQLLSALQSGAIAPSLIPLDVRQRVLESASIPARAELEVVFQRITGDRRDVIEGFAAVVQNGIAAGQDREADLGKQVFGRVCAACHRIAGQGQDVGPPLMQLSSKTPMELLETILDPNREIDPKYASYRVLLADGRAMVGIIESESANQFVLVEAGGQRRVVLRSEVEELASTGQSLMPVGIEQQVSPEQMTALIDFLRSAGQ